MGRYRNASDIKDTVEMIPTRNSSKSNKDRSSSSRRSRGGRRSNSRGGGGRQILTSKSDGDVYKNSKGKNHNNSDDERLNNYIEENGSFHSSSTDSTRPTVHTSTQSWSVEEHHHHYHRQTNKKGRGQRRSSSFNKNTNNNRPGRQRVPGGAAAKLMLRGPKAEEEEDDGNDGKSENNNNNNVSDDDEEEEPVDTSEIYHMIDQTKVEFEKGPPRSRFTPHAEVADKEIEISFVPEADDEWNNYDELLLLSDGDGTANDVDNEKERLPRVLNRSEAYHENASEAVAALLNPSLKAGDTVSVVSGILSDVPSVNSSSRKTGGGSVSAFQYPKFDDVGSIVSGGGGGVDSLMMEEYNINDGGIHKCPTSEPLITGATEARLDQMSKRMLDPSKTLSDLLKAIASPDDTIQVDRAYMVRRKNACGALKVLTAHARKRKQIAWTVGVLPALTSVLQDAGEEGLEVAYPDKRTRMEYEETRKRAIAAIANLSMTVSNRLVVFHTPGLVQALMYLINEDKAECLEGCCAILAYLAKSVENRNLMAQVPGLFEIVLKIIRPNKTKENEEDHQLTKEKEIYPWMSNDSEASSMSSAGSEHSEHTGSSGEFTEGETTGGESYDDVESTDGESFVSEGSCDSMSTGSSEASDNTDNQNPPKNRKGKADHSKKQKICDYDADKHFFAARQNLFAMLGHLVKEKDNAVSFDRFFSHP